MSNLFYYRTFNSLLNNQSTRRNFSSSSSSTFSAQSRSRNWSIVKRLASFYLLFIGIFFNCSIYLVFI